MTSQWPEVASHVGVIEGMHEDEFFSHRDLAALVASKVRGGFCALLVVSFARAAR